MTLYSINFRTLLYVSNILKITLTKKVMYTFEKGINFFIQKTARSFFKVKGSFNIYVTKRNKTVLNHSRTSVLDNRWAFYNVNNKKKLLNEAGV